MLQVKSPILNVFLLMLRIPLDLCLDASHKDNRFSKALPENSLEFAPSKKDSTVAFNLALMLLPTEVDSISKNNTAKETC